MKKSILKLIHQYFPEKKIVLPFNKNILFFFQNKC